MADAADPAFDARCAQLLRRFGESLVANVRRLHKAVSSALAGTVLPTAAAEAVNALRIGTIAQPQFLKSDSEGVLAEVIVCDVLLPFIPAAAACTIPGTSALGDALAA